MTRAVVTGMNGTVAPALAEVLRTHDIEVIPWERDLVPIDNKEAIQEFLELEAPDWFFHVATGPADWAERIARLCHERAIRFLFTSSVSVFDGRKRGPIAVDRRPDATDDYGTYKIECEERILAVNRTAMIARLGWQMRKQRGGNTMTEHFWQLQEQQGEVAVNEEFKPACSYVEDTGEALYQIMRNNLPDTFHLDGNSRSMSLYEIAAELNRHYKEAWNLRPVQGPKVNTRMPDPRVRIAPIHLRLNRPSGPVFIDGEGA